MTRYTISLTSEAQREDAARILAKAPIPSRVEFKSAKRSTEQNDRMWAMLTDVSRQLAWHGEKLRPNDWKLVFLDALRRARKEESRAVKGIDGKSFVSLGKSSSDLTKEEMSDLMEIITAFAIAHDVKLHDPAEAA